MSKFGLFKLVKTGANCNFIRSSCVRYMSEFHHEELSHSTLSYDDLYSPKGSFQEDFQQKNRRYMRYLVGSLGFFALSVFTYFDLGCLPYKALRLQKFENTPAGLEFYEVGKAAMERRAEEFEEAHIDDEKRLVFWRYATPQQLVNGITSAIFPEIERFFAENSSSRVFEKEIQVSFMVPSNINYLLYKQKLGSQENVLIRSETGKHLLKIPKDSSKEDVQKIVIKAIYGDDKNLESISIINQSGEVIFDEEIK